MIVETHDLGHFALGTEGIVLQLAEHLADLDVPVTVVLPPPPDVTVPATVGTDVLIAQVDDLVFDQCRFERGEARRAEGLGEVQTVYFRPDGRIDRLDLEGRVFDDFRVWCNQEGHGDCSVCRFVAAGSAAENAPADAVRRRLESCEYNRCGP